MLDILSDVNPYDPIAASERVKYDSDESPLLPSGGIALLAACNDS